MSLLAGEDLGVVQSSTSSSTTPGTSSSIYSSIDSSKIPSASLAQSIGNAALTDAAIKAAAKQRLAEITARQKGIPYVSSNPLAHIPIPATSLSNFKAITERAKSIIQSKPLSSLTTRSGGKITLTPNASALLASRKKLNRSLNSIDLTSTDSETSDAQLKGKQPLLMVQQQTLHKNLTVSENEMNRIVKQKPIHYTLNKTKSLMAPATSLKLSKSQSPPSTDQTKKSTLSIAETLALERERMRTENSSPKLTDKELESNKLTTSSIDNFRKNIRTQSYVPFSVSKSDQLRNGDKSSSSHNLISLNESLQQSNLKDAPNVAAVLSLGQSLSIKQFLDLDVEKLSDIKASQILERVGSDTIESIKFAVDSTMNDIADSSKPSIATTIANTLQAKERIRVENRERKKKWREMNIEKNRDNDLRVRVIKRANVLFTKAEDDEKKKQWISTEFEKRKKKRLERENIEKKNETLPTASNNISIIEVKPEDTTTNSAAIASESSKMEESLSTPPSHASSPTPSSPTPFKVTSSSIASLKPSIIKDTNASRGISSIVSILGGNPSKSGDSSSASNITIGTTAMALAAVYAASNVESCKDKSQLKSVVSSIVNSLINNTISPSGNSSSTPTGTTPSSSVSSSTSTSSTTKAKNFASHITAASTPIFQANYSNKGVLDTLRFNVQAMKNLSVSGSNSTKFKGANDATNKLKGFNVQSVKDLASNSNTSQVIPEKRKSITSNDSVKKVKPQSASASSIISRPQSSKQPNLPPWQMVPQIKLLQYMKPSGKKSQPSPPVPGRPSMSPSFSTIPSSTVKSIPKPINNISTSSEDVSMSNNESNEAAPIANELTSTESNGLTTSKVAPSASSATSTKDTPSQPNSNPTKDIPPKSVSNGGLVYPKRPGYGLAGGLRKPGAFRKPPGFNNPANKSGNIPKPFAGLAPLSKQ
ncbi:unnamed protein product [[Candida] boidinii]|nr:unnamed protein product [[Candida] boidinii]